MEYKWADYRALSAERAVIENRALYVINNFFWFGLGKPLVTAFVEVPRGKDQPFRLLDDGAGEGVFAEEIGAELGKAGINCHTTALTLHENPALSARHSRGEISEVVVGPAERFVPKRPFHAIVSMIGSTSYTLSPVRKEHLLKFAYSLAPGGLLLAGFEVATEAAKALTPGNIPFGFSRRPKRGRKMPLETEMRGIERAFDKRGFDARFVEYPEVARQIDRVPRWMLIVRRRLPGEKPTPRG